MEGGGRLDGFDSKDLDERESEDLRGNDLCRSGSTRSLQKL